MIGLQHILSGASTTGSALTVVVATLATSARRDKKLTILKVAATKRDE